MCGGVVPQYAITEMETWSCLSVYATMWRATTRCRVKGMPPFTLILMQSEQQLICVPFFTDFAFDDRRHSIF